MARFLKFLCWLGLHDEKLECGEGPYASSPAPLAFGIRIIDYGVRVGDCEACLLVKLALPSMVENVKFDMKNHRAAQRCQRLLVNAIRRIPR